MENRNILIKNNEAMLHTLRIQLANISKPPVWRQIAIPGQFTFHKLHMVIQAAFGWENYHLYRFSERGHIADVPIGIPSDENWEEEIRDSSKIKIQSVFTAEGQKFKYLYDFGDDWLHNITVEKIIKIKASRAELVDGKGMCPPEDCGGFLGYERLKEIMANPKDPEYNEMRAWLGMDTDEIYNPGFFNLERARQQVNSL